VQLLQFDLLDIVLLTTGTVMAGVAYCLDSLPRHN
jgi:hypothetical protein